MKKAELDSIAGWFRGYARGFAGPDGELHYVLGLKLEHSGQVSATAAALAREMSWGGPECVAAEAAGLLHDAGRFSQFAEFKTLSDAASVNHGRRGWEVVSAAGILDALEQPERNLILDSIRHHNARLVPDGLEAESLRFVRLIRDADKLDIFQVVQKAIRENGFRDLEDMLPGFKLDGPLSTGIVDELRSNPSCAMASVKSLADFMLMQLAWVHDINYAASYRQMAAKEIVPRIAERLPADGAVKELVGIAMRLVDERAAKAPGEEPGEESRRFRA
jgi:hypothetical protein